MRVCSEPSKLSQPRQSELRNGVDLCRHNSQPNISAPLLTPLPVPLFDAFRARAHKEDECWIAAGTTQKRNKMAAGKYGKNTRKSRA